MAVAVQIPCRLRIDPEALRAEGIARTGQALRSQGDVVDAFTAAVGRAVRRATREVAEPLGARAELAPDSPVFRWAGPAVDRVSAAQRRDLERRLRRAVRAALAASGTPGRSPTPGRAPLTDRPAELIDRRREQRALRSYRVPSYNGGETVLSFEDEPLTVGPVNHVWRIRPLPGVIGELAELVESAVMQFGELPTGAPVGLLIRGTGPGGEPLWGVIVNSTPPSRLAFSHFFQYTFRADTGVFELDTSSVPPAMPGTAERRLVSDRAGLLALARDLMGLDIRSQIMTALPRDENNTSASEYEEQVTDAVERELERRTDEVITSLGGANPTSVVIVRVGGAASIVVSADDAELHWVGTANLLPVTTEVPRGRDEEQGSGTGGGGEGAGRRGSGAGDGEGSGTGTGPGTGPGSGTRRGGFVFDPSLPDAPPGTDDERSRFPIVNRGGRTPQCQALNGEPDVSELGSIGEELRRRIDDIAYRLQINPCYFAARFCVTAAQALASRAADISAYISATEREAFTTPVPEGTGELGPIRFRPVASPAMQFLRHLAGVVPRIHNLSTLVMGAYGSAEHWPRIDGGWINTPVSWNLHFLQELSPALKTAVGQVFVSGCQAMLLQLLLSSQRGINARLDNFARYAPIFERLLVSQLTDYAELQRLRDRLDRHETARTIGTVTDPLAVAVSGSPAMAWLAAARGVSSAFIVTETAVTVPGTAGEIVETDGTARIRDSHGVMWSKADIDQALVLQRGEAEGIDPLVKQITDLPDVLERFTTNRGAIQSELRRVLGEMKVNNLEMLGKARADAWFAFRASRISEHIPSATVPGSRYALQGIHLEVHNQLGEFFGGDPFYPVGIDFLFGSEAGREALSAIGLTVGIIALSVLCPPLGFIVGIGVAAHDVVRAHERERLYGSMIDPELVLTRAEVEVELFAAYLGLALSFVPEAGTALGAARRGVRVALRAGVGRGVRAAGRFVVRRWTRQVIQALSRDLLTEFITQVMMTAVLERVIQRVMEPILSYVEREAMIRESVGGPEGAAFVLMVLDSERAHGGGP